jgi:hypothetical protein
MLGVGPVAALADSGVWQLQGARNRVYIAGSIHLLKPENAAIPPALDRAYQDAERLVFELDLDDLDEQALAAEMLSRGTRTDGRTLSATLPAALRAKLDASAAQRGLPLAALEGMEPWLSALMLTSVDLMQRGFKPEAGIDQQLATRAKQDRKPVTGLETPAEQFAVFDDLNPILQTRMLEMTLNELDEAEAAVDAIHDAWRRGDLAALERAMNDGFDDFPELEAALLDARNLKWLPQVRALLQSDDDVLVVVGAAHLVGKRGLIKLLQDSGLKPQNPPAR